MATHSHSEDLTPGLLSLLSFSMPEASQLAVANLNRVFGGNARAAWGFELSWTDRHGVVQRLPCIMLCQVAGGHVDSSVASEYGLLSAITGRGSRAPAAIAMDEDGRFVGAPAIVLERIEGEANAVAFLNEPDVEVGITRCRDLACATAELHRIDIHEADLASGVTPNQAALNQVSLWEEKFLAHRQEPLPVVAHLFSWLREHCPTPKRLCLVHGDLRPGNFLYRANRITALLDWEMGHLGDPAEDIAWIYRPLWSPEKFLSVEDFLVLYREAAGFDPGLENLRFYQVFSEMKFAALSLTASHSVATGQSDNLRHMDRAAKVPATLARCFELIDGSYREAANAIA